MCHELINNVHIKFIFVIYKCINRQKKKVQIKLILQIKKQLSLLFNDLNNLKKCVFLYNK